MQIMQDLKVTQAQDETTDPRAVKKQCFRGRPVDKALYSMKVLRLAPPT